MLVARSKCLSPHWCRCTSTWLVVRCPTWLHVVGRLGPAPEVCGRWSTQRSQEILTAYFNAIGYAAWENIFGIWNGIHPRDGELLRRSSMILRDFHDFLSAPL